MQAQQDAIFQKDERIRDLDGIGEGRNEEIQRLEGIKNQLTEMVKSNRAEITRLRQDLDKADAELARNVKQLADFKAARARQFRAMRRVAFPGDSPTLSA